MTPNSTGDPRRYRGWRINLAAAVLVIATLLIGYGLAHPRDLPLPFGVDASPAASVSAAG